MVSAILALLAMDLAFAVSVGLVKNVVFVISVTMVINVNIHAQNLVLSLENVLTDLQEMVLA